ncbi:MAG: hypothetical protein ACI9TH_000781 [Kiritimatiellia bacterium]|jgi:hypothetical protein
MKIITTSLFALFLLTSAVRVHAAEGRHLFILSGQSNMAGMNPDESFAPAVEKAFGKEHVIVVKDAVGGQPIRRWDKKWELGEGGNPEQIGDLYSRLMAKVTEATQGRKLASVTFVWMQGERDARESHGALYEASFKRLLDQLRTDLGRKDLNFVIGRLSDFDMENKIYPHWTQIRDVQVKLSSDVPRGAWIDCDDLNDGTNRKGKEIRNDLHMSVEGYKTMGQRFAAAAIQLIQS